MDEGPNELLKSAVAEAVGGRVTALGRIERTPLEYDAFLAHRSVSRVRGIAAVGGTDVEWSMIEKRTEGPGLATSYLLDNGAREFDAYASGVLDDIAPGVAAPRLYGSELDSEGGRTLWLEEIGHDGTRPLDAEMILAAAHDLGQMGGRWVGRELAEPWYFTGWIDRHSQPEAVERGLRSLRDARPATSARLGDRLVAAERLVLEQARYRSFLESLPHTLCHHDAVGANLFRSDSRTVLIDWESIGAGPVGADLASLLFSSVRRGDARAGVLVPIVDEAVNRYSEALRAEAGHITPEEIRLGFDAAIALRWKLAADIVAGMDAGHPPRRGSLPGEEPVAALEDLIALLDLLLNSAERARKRALS